MEYSKLNDNFLINLDDCNINEVAKIEKDILVHNYKEQVNNGIFAHFHYKDVRYKFSDSCPQNINQLKKLIAFEIESSKVNEADLIELLALLTKYPTEKNRGNYNTVYDKVIDVWETLNEREADYIDV